MPRRVRYKPKEGQAEVVGIVDDTPPERPAPGTPMSTAPSVGQQRAGKTLGGHTAHDIWTINVGGSREALLNSFALEAEVLMIQEH